MARFEKSAPWDEYYEKIKAFFKKDKDVCVMILGNDVRLYVRTAAKAAALQKALKEEIRSPETDVLYCTLTVVPPNDEPFVNVAPVDVIKTAFEGNPIVVDIKQRSFPFDFTYVLFEPVVVRYYDGSLAEWDRYSSTLYQFIAKDIFKPLDGLYWSTDATGEEIDPGVWMGCEG